MMQHDIDRTQQMLGESYEFNFPQSEAESGEAFEGEGYEMESPLGEAETMEVASEMLEVQSEEELEQFLGSLVNTVAKAASGAASAIGNFARTPVGQQLVGVLKQAAKTALPAAGTAVGTYFGGPVGAKLGSFAGEKLGQAMGLELEGLSNEDQHFEVAQQFVRLASAAAQNAAANLGSGPPQQLAKNAFIEAAKVHAPGLIRPIGTSGGARANGGGAMGGAVQSAGYAGRGKRSISGRWFRRGNTLVLTGA
jgi:hypothetical protein